MKNKFNFNITIKEEKSLKSIEIKEPIKLFEQNYIAIEKEDIIIYNFNLKKKLSTLKFHSHQIASIQLCKMPYLINNSSIQSNNIFFVLSSSWDKKFAVHKIIYKDNFFQFELVTENKPTKDEINGAIQIENGQFIICTRDQHIILFSRHFKKLYEIKKDWPMEAERPFEIKKNIIGVYWDFDEAEYDGTDSDEEVYDQHHSHDGLYIYEVKNNEMKEIKFIPKMTSSFHSLIYHKNNLIMKYNQKYNEKISTLDLTNLKFINNLYFTKDNSINWDIAPYNNKYFIVIIYGKNKSVKFKIYENRTFKIIYESETFQNAITTDGFYFKKLYKLDNNKYLFHNLIINIEPHK